MPPGHNLDQISLPGRPYNFPPMSSLVSFEAAARNASFKAAAEELNVTPAAISHQVKALERDLRLPLFRRHHRGVELTELGAYLLVALQRGFEGISEALDQLRRQTSQMSVTIHSSTAVSSLWLTPRLAEFWRTHDQISVSQIVSDRSRDTPVCDLSIRYGDMTQETDPCRALFKDTITALGSPGFARQHRIDSIADLGTLPLIHIDMAEDDWTTWQQWSAALGYHGPLRASHRVNNYVIALQAARDGMGAILGWNGLTGDLVASGRLVQLLPESLPSPLDFYIVMHNQNSDKARVVFDWLAGG